MDLRRTLIAVAVAGTAVVGATAGFASGTGGQDSEATPKRGGSITIARIEDSQSFDKTNVFQNESIWLTQQIMEPLYTATRDGKTLKPWLATSYTKSRDGKTYTFKLRPGVRFSNGKAMTSADVKFSIDDARAQDKGWGFLDVAIKSIVGAEPEHGRLQPEVPVDAVRRRHRAVRERDHPQQLRRREARRVLQAPGRHGPVHVGQAGRRPVRDVQAQPVLLAEGQAVSRQRDSGPSSPTRTPASSSSAAGRSRSTSSRRSTRSRSSRGRLGSRCRCSRRPGRTTC